MTDDTFYLDRSLAQAQRLRDTRVVAGDAWYFPNRPSKQRHGKPGEFIAAPYYSALAQGRVLMFFSRLAEVTGSRSGATPPTRPSPASCARDRAPGRTS